MHTFFSEAHVYLFILKASPVTVLTAPKTDLSVLFVIFFFFFKKKVTDNEILIMKTWGFLGFFKKEKESPFCWYY